MSSVVYDYGGGLYINLTNKCPCKCDFCIRNFTDRLGDADSLFLDKEPTVEEVKEELKKWNPAEYEEVVFCGYGEPTERLDVLLEIAKYIRSEYIKEGSKLKIIRLNTNGLADLIWGEPTAHKLQGIIDTVSISLNEADAEKYEKLCHPKFGIKSYDAMIDFIKDVKNYVPNVATSVVGVISEESIGKCREKAKELDVAFRIR